MFTLPLNMQFMVGGPFIMGFVIFALSYLPRQVINKIKIGLKNQKDQKKGEFIAIQGVVISPNAYQTPVLETPVAAAYWEIDIKNNFLVCKKIIGSTFEIKCDDVIYKIQIRPDDFLYRAPNSLRPNWFSNKSFMNRAKGITAQKALENFTKLSKQEGLDFSLMGIKDDLMIREYPVESQKNYSVLGKLIESKTITGDEDDTLVIFNIPIQKLIQKLNVQIMALQVGGAALTGASVVLYFHLKNLS